MKKTSLTLSLLLVFAGGVWAEEDEMHEKCKDAKDYVGCVKIFSGADVTYVYPQDTLFSVDDKFPIELTCKMFKYNGTVFFYLSKNRNKSWFKFDKLSFKIFQNDGKKRFIKKINITAKEVSFKHIDMPGYGRRNYVFNRESGILNISSGGFGECKKGFD